MSTAMSTSWRWFRISSFLGANPPCLSKDTCFWPSIKVKSGFKSMELIILWSIGWIKEVVFSGRKTTSMLLSSRCFGWLGSKHFKTFIFSSKRKILSWPWTLWRGQFQVATQLNIQSEIVYVPNYWSWELVASEKRVVCDTWRDLKVIVYYV